MCCLGWVSLCLCQTAFTAPLIIKFLLWCLHLDIVLISSARMESMHLTLILIGISVLHPRMDALEKLDEPVLLGPSAALEGSVVDFFCDIPEKPATLSVQYELYVETNPGKMIGEYSSLSGELATFSLIITEEHDGRLICKASGHNDTDIDSSFSNGMDFRVIVPVKELSIISHPYIENIWEGQTLTLQCTKTKGTYVSYDWLWNDTPVQMPYDRNNDTLTIHRVSAQNAGNYMCVASNQYNDTTIFNSSSDVTVSILEYVSKPEFSFDVVKLDDGGYKAIITCQSKKGTPLNTFSLLNHTDLIATETTDTTSAIFNMPIELNRYMGQMKCNASNEGNWVLSDPYSLTVESVGGAVTVTPFKQVGLDFQVVNVELHCKVERGTFPQYSWFLNDSRLLGQGGFYADKFVLSLSVGRDSAGFYHCQASDRFDNSTSIRSPKMLISKEALNTVSPLVVIVVFTSFALLNVAVITCCIYGVVLRRRYSRQYLLTEQRRKMRITDKQEDEEEEDEDYLMLEGYEEDVVQADRLSDSAEDEDQSVDESVLYEGAVSE
ncbi:platelet endothelial cell adhesion molecule isoform X1 [Sinocyclocheilus grahami]|uniref:platelet endothelial cell adhesion molecule isoform X1 n=1 Tax=Sinocyclocheilus grahami TaxID=75366 RepID=UPI0007AC9654|nr:PREDICTED: platelet endothelial cell adhesion molecule-like isoform X1 [Sinocyclocheilus grahami]